MAKFDELLPIGSVVRVKGAQRNLMICGRVVTRTGFDDIYDYVACLYPEGLIDASDLYFFNRTAVDECVYKGFEGEEELAFREHVLGTLNEVEVIDGKIVPKQ